MKKTQVVLTENNNIYTIHQPKIIISPTPEEVDKAAAQLVMKQIQLKPNSVFTLPTGSTPIGMYKYLIQAYEKKNLDLSKVTVFNLDEYWPIDKNHPESYFQFMCKNFLSHVNVPSINWYIPNGSAVSPEDEACRYESLIRMHGPVDLAVLGIGPGKTCHIGFNEKNSSIESRVRYVLLDTETRTANARFFKSIEHVPKGAITQGIATILDAKKNTTPCQGRRKSLGYSSQF